MASDPIRNALGRYADVQICDKYGMDEAVRDFIGKPLSLTEWSIMAVAFDVNTTEEQEP